MQFLYKEGDDLVFMDQTNYEQVTIAADLVGEAHDLMKDNLPCTVLFFNERPVDVTLPTFVFLEVTASRARRRAATPAATCQKPATVETGATSACRCSSASATRSRSTRARTSTSSASTSSACDAAACSRSTATSRGRARASAATSRVADAPRALAARRPRRRATRGRARVRAATVPGAAAPRSRGCRARGSANARGARARAARGRARSSPRAASSRSRRRCSCRRPGLEIHLDAVRAGDGCLITSPEYQMKRLLAGGLRADLPGLQVLPRATSAARTTRASSR